MELRGRRVLVMGLGRTGRSAVRYLADRGALVVAADEAPGPSLGDLSELSAGVTLRVGVPFPSPGDFDLVVPSPGVPAQRWRGARAVTSDIELAARALAVPLVAVTGSNGKTTTVLLLEAMLRAAGLRVRAAGNIGTPALDLIGEALDAAVFEVSSFQLEASGALRPAVAALLNLAPDHLDRHGDLERYGRAKARLFRDLREEDVVIGNADDGAVRALVEVAPGRHWWFARRPGVVPGAWGDAGAVWLHVAESAERITLPEVTPPAVAPPLESVLVATLACAALGADPRRAVGALATFRPPPHRREVIARDAGITWVNDAVATNPAAARYALRGATGPVIWIAGGRPKGDLDTAPLLDEAVCRARAAVLIGEAAPRLERDLAGRLPAQRAADLEEAVAVAASLARPGDTVLLSPAYASTDQFQNYEERGECFRRAVTRALGRAEGVGA